MSNPNAVPPEHTKWKPGQSGNPAGKPKGTKHISTWIQEMLNDEDFTIWLQHPTQGVIEYKGAPLKAIIGTAMNKAVNNDAPAREWLAKHGYGTNVNLNVADTRKEILDKYGLGEADAGQVTET